MNIYDLFAPVYADVYEDIKHARVKEYFIKGGRGSGKSTYIYGYDSKGRLTKETNTYQSSDGTSKSVTTYAYSKAGNLTKTVESISDGDYAGKVVTTYTYQKNGA